MELNSSTTAWMMEQWALWAKANPEVSIGYPSTQPFTRMQGSTVRSPLITDDEAVAIDSVVSKLRQRDKEMAEVTALYFFSGGNLSAVSRQMGLDRKRVGVLVSSGTAWVDGVMCSLVA